MENLDFKTEGEVLSFLEKNKETIRFVRIIFSDVLGREMSFCVPSEKMKSAFRQGAGFDGSSVEGFARIEESDLIIVPDPTTFRVLPWSYELQNVAWKEAVIFGDIFNSKGDHFEGDSRYALKKVLEKTKKFGSLYFGPELEFFIFENEKSPKLLDHGGYFYGGKLGEIRKLIQIYLQEMGIKTECDHHEASPSQHEINLKYNKALAMADSVVLAKYITKKVTRELGFFASFMPKPITEINGSGMHLHLSLWEKDKNLFFESESLSIKRKNDSSTAQIEKETLSRLAKKYLTGLIKYGQEIQIILNQSVNSYKRLIPGYEAPVYLAWGRKNRSTYIRVPETHLAEAETATRIEIRSPDPACNIYLALAIIQSAGIQGIKENLKFLPPEEKDIFEMTKNEIKKKKIKTLANDLEEALGHFQKSELAKEALGAHLFDKIIQNKKIEWRKYKKVAGKKFKRKVSPYEIEKYLPVL